MACGEACTGYQRYVGARAALLPAAARVPRRCARMHWQVLRRMRMLTSRRGYPPPHVPHIVRVPRHCARMHWQVPYARRGSRCAALLPAAAPYTAGRAYGVQRGVQWVAA